MKKILALIVLISVTTLTGCISLGDFSSGDVGSDTSTDNNVSGDTSTDNNTNDNNDTSTDNNSSVDTNDIFSTRDYNETIMYTECEISLTNLAASNSMVEITDTTITITQKGSYTFSGTSNNVTIIIDTEDKVQLILDNVTMTSDNFALIHMIESDKTICTTRWYKYINYYNDRRN